MKYYENNGNLIKIHNLIVPNIGEFTEITEKEYKKLKKEKAEKPIKPKD